MSSADGSGSRRKQEPSPREEAAAWLPPARVLALQSGQVKISSHLLLHSAFTPPVCPLPTKSPFRVKKQSASCECEQTSGSKTPQPTMSPEEKMQEERDLSQAYHISRQVLFKCTGLIWRGYLRSVWSSPVSPKYTHSTAVEVEQPGNAGEGSGDEAEEDDGDGKSPDSSLP